MTRIVQSFWSGGNPDPIKGTYGWLKPEYNLMSWTLSSHLIRRHYDDLVLYTDKAGEELLVKRLRLPYTEVHVDLDSFNGFPSGAWPLSKIFVYSRQRKPFLYLDGDVFIWRRFEQNIEQASLAVQNVELIPKESYEAFVTSLDFVPELLKDCSTSEEKFRMVNTGVFGGTEYDLLEEYYRIAYEVTTRNRRLVESSQMTFGLFVEQFMLTRLIENRRVNVQKVFNETFDNSHYAGFADFTQVPTKKTYLHLLGMYKTNPRAIKLLNNQLRQEFPEAYNRLLDVADLGKDLQDSDILRRDIECHRYYQLINDEDKSRLRIVIDRGTSLAGIDHDELDVELFKCLSEEKTLQQLLDDMSVYFEDGSGLEYEELIIERLKTFVFNRMVFMKVAHAPVISH